MKRRDAIIGIGGLMAGSGALVGTGAFTSVQADRSVSVETATDSAAALQIIKAQDDAGDPTPNGDEYIDDSGGTIEIDLTGTSNGATGVNQNAITNIDRLLQVTNNGTQEVAVGFNDQYAIDQGDYGDDENKLPGGWAYAVDSDESAVVVVWMSPFPPFDDDTLEGVRPDLTTTGFDGSTLVDGRNDAEVEDRTERTIATGERLHVGAIVDTRSSTIADNPIPSELDSTITFSAESTN